MKKMRRSCVSPPGSECAFLRTGSFLLGLVAWLFAGCTTVPQTPAFHESTFFYTVQSGFHISARHGTVRYTVTLEPREALIEPLFIRARWENPADPATPLTNEVIFDPDEESLILESDPLRGLRANRVYRVDLLIFTDPETPEPDDTHTIFIRSIITTRK
jgi:hypothetical protein